MKIWHPLISQVFPTTLALGCFFFLKLGLLEHDSSVLYSVLSLQEKLHNYVTSVAQFKINEDFRTMTYKVNGCTDSL